MRERVEQRVDEVLAPYFDALTGAVVHGFYQGDFVLTEHPDLAARISAAEKLLDRVYGRPRQQVEHSGPDGGPVQVADVDLRALPAEDLEQLERILAKAADGAAESG
jgi:hypothetical protein